MLCQHGSIRGTSDPDSQPHAAGKPEQPSSAAGTVVETATARVKHDQEHSPVQAISDKLGALGWNTLRYDSYMKPLMKSLLPRIEEEHIEEEQTELPARLFLVS
eukprot:Nk52_evm60s1810 gene=Nk52_evmTU60s1810